MIKRMRTMYLHSCKLHYDIGNFVDMGFPSTTVLCGVHGILCYLPLVFLASSQNSLGSLYERLYPSVDSLETI